MAIQIQGYSGAVAEVDGFTYRAMRITLRPLDYGAYGQYRCGLWQGGGNMSAGLAANSEVYQVRWVSTPQLAIIWGIQLDGLFAFTTGFAAGFAQFTLTIARSWTVDGSGGIAATLTNSNMLRTSMPSSLMGALRISGGSALTAGTKTLDAQPVGQLAFTFGTAANTPVVGQLALYGAPSIECGGNPAPIVLAQNEGVVARATVPGTGTWGFSLTMAWSEVTTY